MSGVHRIVLALALGASVAEGAMDPMAKLENEVAGLRTTQDAWRRIPWRTCLLSAAREARDSGRPLFLWALGGDPAGRC